MYATSILLSFRFLLTKSHFAEAVYMPLELDFVSSASFVDRKY
jgi:hypothetical protein